MTLHQIPSKLHLLFYQCFGPGCFLSRGLFVQAFYVCLQAQSDEQYKIQTCPYCTFCMYSYEFKQGVYFGFFYVLYSTLLHLPPAPFSIQMEKKRLCTLLFLLGPATQGSCSLHSSVCSPCQLQSQVRILARPFLGLKGTVA